MSFQEVEVKLPARHVHDHILAISESSQLVLTTDPRSEQEMAQFDLPLDDETRHLVGYAMNWIKSDRLDEDGYLEPGTVFRCEGDPEPDSVVFAAIPNLHSTPYGKMKAVAHQTTSQGVCRERKLRGAFGSSLSARQEQSKDRFATDGRDGQHDLWVRQTWMLVTDRCQYFPVDLHVIF